MTPEQIQEAVKKGFEDDQRKKFDPYRSAIVFLAGLLAFCLTIIVGIFAIMPDLAKWQGNGPAPMIGGVLAWISLAALAATAAMFVVQFRKAHHFHRVYGFHVKPRHMTFLFLMTGIPVVLGAVAVYYCVRGGAALLGATAAAQSAASAAEQAAPPLAWPTFWDALCKLFF